MSTTGTEMLVETILMETTENTIETMESVAAETETTNGTLCLYLITPPVILLLCYGKYLILK